MTQPSANPIPGRSVGILLAGGLSRRYGSAKAFAEYEGRSFHERGHEALSGACDLVIVSASEALAPDFPAAYEVCADLPQLAGLGPLAGLASVMQRYPAERYIVLPCDMPRIGPQEIRRLRAAAEDGPAADIAALRSPEAGDLPLLSVWRGGLADLLEKRVLSGHLGVMKLLAELDTLWVDAALIHADPAIFHNFNVPPDAG
ncbi:molybdenum cofactor guanylyltransferase [Saccharibacillus deserti]|uniref:molybdenum cofactor guanylyltransferase n=1 Tax=Saccharibacillus deserti TaxID=1634444 RepID=UPI0015582D17|nr:molybdenum cofactor guanylyltransferase [Saccharibacillus deserti]